MTESLLIVFTKNLIEGKVKTRLATSIGNADALKVYARLLDHTKHITTKLNVQIRIGYSEYIDETDSWESSKVSKFIQEGADLGERMKQAFEAGFKDGFRKVVLIGSDCYTLGDHHLRMAFKLLEENPFVIGPASDGGYYLIGMTDLNEKLFQNKSWGTDSVLQQTLEDLTDETVFLLEELNDIDTIDDLQEHKSLFKRISR